MKTKRKFTTNSRLVNELFANYISTFTAFCELINNSIQANAKNIRITLDYTGETELHPLLIKNILIQDDGNGVHINDLEVKILDIGTANKEDGKGIGRFASFQIGKTVTIETIGFSNKDKTYSKAIVPLSFDMFGKNLNVSEIDFDTTETILTGKHSTYYKVFIQNLYDTNITESEPRKKIIDKFLFPKIQDAIFERYPLKIFNKDVTFFINGNAIDPKDFVIGKPIKKIKKYTDKKGEEHDVLFDFMHIKNMDKIKVFLTTKNAGIQTIANGFEYDANWLSPKIGGWFIYISSDSLPSDMYRNVDLDGLDENVRDYKDFVKNELTDFFKDKNKEFDNFTDKLKKDIYYPYHEKTSSQSKVILFDKLAYIIEDKYHILNEQNRLREIVYPLIDRTISNGGLEKVLRGILKLNNKMMTKFSDLLEKTDLENIIEFSDKVASKIEDVEFLEKLVYSDIAKNVKERKELHKFIEKMLWVFGEEYNDSTRLLSDKGLEGNLIELRNKFLTYKASKEADNICEIKEKTIKSITDLFLYSEKIIDINQREVLIIELKAPKVKISPKELDQVMKYAQEIEEMGVFPDRLKYKILLVSSDINKRAKFDIVGRQKGIENPYFYFKNETGNIEVWVVKWSELLENTKRKLKYMSNILETKDVGVQEKAQRDFEDIDFIKTSSSLKKVAVA
jgi:hypothetical protein